MPARSGEGASGRVPCLLEISSTKSGLTWRLSGGALEQTAGTASGSPYELRDYLLDAGADPDLVVVSGSGGIGIDIRGGGSSTAAAEQRWILAESWARLADSVNGHYWTPREPGRPERIARAYVGRDAFVQVVLHQDSEDRDIIACGGPVYIWAPTSMTHEARGGLGSLARGCCTRVVFGIVSTKIAAAAAPPKRRGWIFW